MKLKHLVLWLFITITAPHLWGFNTHQSAILFVQSAEKQKNNPHLSFPSLNSPSFHSSQIPRIKPHLAKIHNKLFKERVPHIERQAHQLQLDFPTNRSIQKLIPVVFDLTSRALRERSLINAYRWVDVAEDLVTLGSNLVKGTKAVARGAKRGIKTMLTTAHYKEFAVGITHAVKSGFEQMAVADEFEDIMFCADHKVATELLVKHENKLNQQTLERAAQWKLLSAYLKKTSWDELLETGSEFGVILLLDAVVLNAAGWATTELGQQLIAKLAQASFVEPLAAEFATEAAGIGKLMVERGEIKTLKAVEEMGAAESIALKSGKAKERIKEFVPVHKVRKDRNIFEGFQFKDHIFSEKHVNDGIYNLGSTKDIRSKEEILEKFRLLIQKLYDEEKLMVGDNQIHTAINGQTVEIRANFGSDGNLRSVNGFPNYSDRIMDNKIIL